MDWCDEMRSTESWKQYDMAKELWMAVKELYKERYPKYTDNQLIMKARFDEMLTVEEARLLNREFGM